MSSAGQRSVSRPRALGFLALPAEAGLFGARGVPPAWARSVARAEAPAAMVFGAGLALRVAFLTLARTYVFAPDHFGFGWEAGRIAKSLAEGGGFSHPFQGPTGPTAWLPPLYPLILAGIFKAFGTYSALAGWMALTFNSVCSAFTGVILLWTGRELFSERTGRWAGWAWAFFPYAIYWPARVVWDTSLTATLLALVFLLTVRLGRSSSPGSWTLFGLAWGLLALASPAALSFAPPSLAWVYWEERRRNVFEWRWGLRAGLVALACVAPWLVRNQRAFSQPVFIRSNLGEELRLGNGPVGFGEWMSWLHPSQSSREFERYRRMGEVAYVAEREREALEFIAENPGLFWANTIRRIYWFWAGTTKGDPAEPAPFLRAFAFLEGSLLTFAGLGLMIRRGKRESLLFASLFLFFPLVYYVTFVLVRYRHPIEPEMFLLIVYLFAEFPLSPRAAGETPRAWRPALSPRGTPVGVPAGPPGPQA